MRNGCTTKYDFRRGEIKVITYVAEYKWRVYSKPRNTFCQETALRCFQALCVSALERISPTVSFSQASSILQGPCAFLSLINRAHTQTPSPTMTAFFISDLLGTEAISLASDNAAGHGKHIEQERRRQRQHSRIQSQHFMCRKPRRTADEQSHRAAIQTNECNSTLSPFLSPGRLSPIPKYCAEKLNMAQHTNFTVQDCLQANRPSCSPTNLEELTIENHSKPSPLTAISPRNACKPRRRASIDAFEPIQFLDQTDQSEQNDSPSQNYSCRQAQQLDGNTVSLLQDILSSIDL